jgi:hypothetical protein
MYKLFDEKYPPLLVSSHDAPQRMEPDQYVHLLEKYWNIETAIEMLLQSKTLYTPTHKFELCE